jgi:type VI protein secretion system component Hcp
MESTMSANTNTSGVSELTDGELDAVNGGIIVVCGQQVGALTQTIGSASSGAGAGKVSFNEFSITKKIDSASPKL